MKKIRLVYALIILSFVAVFGVMTVTTQATVLSTPAEGAVVTRVDGDNGTAYGSFYLDQVRESLDFGYGVTEENIWGYSTSGFSGYDIDGYTGISGVKVAGKYYSQNLNTIIVTPSSEVLITPWANVNGSVWTLTTVKNNIADFEAKNPGYTVLCAINGNSFDINGTGNFRYQPSGPQVSFGNVYEAGEGYPRIWGFVNDGTANSVISTMHTSYTLGDFALSIYDAKGAIVATYPVATNNAAPADGGTSVWYGSYDSNHNYVSIDMTANGSTFVVGKKEDNVILENGGRDFYGKGAIDSTTARTLLENEFAIQTTNADLASALASGTTIRVQRVITGDFANCDFIMGTFHRLYENSTYITNVGLDDSRAPRTMYGVRADGTIVLSVVDGRQGGTTVDSALGLTGMYGMDGAEEAAVLKYYGCVEGMNLDGGGSSTVVVKDATVSGGYRVMNYPSDGNERRDGNCVLIAVKQPDLTIEFRSLAQTSTTVAITVNDAMGFDLTNLYLQFAGSDEFLPFDDQKELLLSGLTSNTSYSFKLFYGDKDSPTELLLEKSFTTLKIWPDYRSITYVDDGTYYVFSFNCTDPDKAVISVMLYFSAKKHATMTDGSFKVAKTAITEAEMKSIYVKYSYKLLSDGDTKSCSNGPDLLTDFERLSSVGSEISANILK